MAFYTHFPTTELTPLFRLLDDYDTHRSTQSKQKPSPSNIRRPRQTFTPSFDVREVNDSYYLDGELPGAHQDNIQIEFTDPHTLVIKGQTTQAYEAQHDTQADLDANASTRSGASSPKSYHVTVEDAKEDGDDTVMSAGGQSASRTPSQDNTTVTKSKLTSSKDTAPQFKYWVSERSFGEFCRTFNFPQRVNQDAVRANLKDGILSVVVPKAPAHTAKKIRVE